MMLPNETKIRPLVLRNIRINAYAALRRSLEGDCGALNATVTFALAMPSA